MIPKHHEPNCSSLNFECEIIGWSEASRKGTVSSKLVDAVQQTCEAVPACQVQEIASEVDQHNFVCCLQQ